MPHANSTILLSPREATKLLSNEIRRLQHRLERLENGMEHIYTDGDDRISGVEIAAFQELDMLAQSTDALAAYVERLSLRLDGTTTLNLAADLSKIPLRELARRLSGGGPDELVANAPELF